MADVLGDALLTTVADPRAGARRVLGWQLTWPQIGLMVLTATFTSLLIIAIFVMVMPDTAQVTATDVDVADAPPQGSSLFELVAQSFITFGVGSLLVYWIGRAFGGAGRLQEVASAMAWFNLLEPGVLALLLIGMALPSPLREVAMLGVAIWTLWIFACIVAE
ncbi:MAG: YIP1 family protein, partial [Pseudomonadota bacterium]